MFTSIKVARRQGTTLYNKTTIDYLAAHSGLKSKKSAIFAQRSVWQETQSVELTMYPDVLKIKTIIIVKQNVAKMPFVYYLQITNPWSGHPDARMSKPQSSQTWICK